MASRAKKDDPSEPRGANGVLFINYDLTDGDKVNFKKWRDKYSADFPQLVTDLVSAGYQISLKEDTYNKCQGAFLISKSTKTENDGYILTGRSSTAWGALAGVLFRHFVIFEGAWPVNNRHANPLDDPDE